MAEEYDMKTDELIGKSLKGAELSCCGRTVCSRLLSDKSFFLNFQSEGGAIKAPSGHWTRGR